MLIENTYNSHFIYKEGKALSATKQAENLKTNLNNNKQDLDKKIKFHIKI